LVIFGSLIAHRIAEKGLPRRIHFPKIFLRSFENVAPEVRSCLMSTDVFSLWTAIVLCTSLHVWTLLFCIYYYHCCCTVCTAPLFSYSAIFIAASVRNKLIHSYDVCSPNTTFSVQNALESVWRPGPRPGPLRELERSPRLPSRCGLRFRINTVDFVAPPVPET